MNKFQIIGFNKLSAVVNELQQNTGLVRFVSGATDFINEMHEMSCNCVIDVSQIKELQYVKAEAGLIGIGSGMTFTDLAAHKLIREKITALAEAAEQLGSVQIRNRATIGGNIASASPANDSLPILVAFDASIVVRGPEGTRTISAADIKKNFLRDKELITEIIFPLTSNWRSSFGKIGSRTTVSIAKLSMAMLVEYNFEQNKIISGKIALGALGLSPTCPVHVQHFMKDQTVDSAFAIMLADLLTETVNEMIPGRASRPYKAEAIKGLTFDVISRLFGIQIQQLTKE